MGMTIKQVLIGAVVGSTVVGLAVLRIRQGKFAHQRPTQLASIRMTTHQPAHKNKHAKSHEVQLSSRKLIG
jgi:hypothetical protein